MRFTNIQYLERECITVSVQNVNAAKTFLDGQVVFAISYDQLVTNAAATPPTSQLSSLGVSAMTANDAAGSTTNSGAFAIGVVKVNPTTANTNLGAQTAATPIGGVTEAVCYGFTDAIVQLRTRATSTDVWAATTILAADQLGPETVNNNLSRVGTVALSSPKVQFAAAQSSGVTSLASGGNTNVPSTGTVETTRMKVRVSCM